MPHITMPAFAGAALAVAVSATAVTGAQAQTATAVHRHYEKPADAQEPAAGMPVAPRLQNLGVHIFPVTTRSARARQFINQGINLAYGFNHAEAARAFAEAARLDPGCAMAYAGHALVLGPNINGGMEAAVEPEAYGLAQKALKLKGSASPRERAFIDAIAARYTGKAEDRKQADRAFADAMRKVVQAFPNDGDARTIFAESLMDLRPWNYWTRDGVPYAETTEIIASLEQVLKKNPNHPGALHYWIHLWEPTDTPERAEAEADRLLPLMPGAGHIIHMPAHIYQRVGRHADVVKANQLAAKADEDYIAQCKAQGVYPLGYYPHNLHFIWMGATASGQSRLALESARKVAASIPKEAAATVPSVQAFLVVPYWAMVRFAQWDDILADKGPQPDTAFTRGAWRYARAMALTARDRIPEAETELEELKKVLADESLKAPLTANTGLAILRIAPEVIAGEIAARRKDWDKATLHLERGVRYEDALIYQEPADWHAPVRQNLAAVLLDAGRPDEAEAVLWEDLKKNPENGWALYGLVKALKAQNKMEDAAVAEERFKRAWKDADITLTAPRIGS
jgi:tetratricopeptide (TPR) repeat protein